MDQLAVARQALETEIAALNAEIQRLSHVLASIDPTALASVGQTASLSRRAVEQVHHIEKSQTDSVIDQALNLIRESGRKGIKALALASQLKKSGIERPTKEALIGTGKVRVSGKGGGTTYSFAG